MNQRHGGAKQQERDPEVPTPAPSQGCQARAERGPIAKPTQAAEADSDGNEGEDRPGGDERQETGHATHESGEGHPPRGAKAEIGRRVEEVADGPVAQVTAAFPYRQQWEEFRRALRKRSMNDLFAVNQAGEAPFEFKGFAGAIRNYSPTAFPSLAGSRVRLVCFKFHRWILDKWR